MACQDDFNNELRQVEERLKEVRDLKIHCIQNQKFDQAARFRRQETWLSARIRKLHEKNISAGTNKSSIPTRKRIEQLESLVEQMENRIEELERRLEFGSNSTE